MTPEEIPQLRQAFEDLVAAPAERRADLLRDFARRHPGMAPELERMLAAHLNRASLLDQPLAETLDPEPEEMPVLRAGSQIGAYVLERELGRGGMGVVYEAWRADGSFRKRVAIKILRHGRFDQALLDRFHQERQILAQLDHPHIAAILDGGTTADGEPYFVMEYVDGRPIARYCESHGATLAQKLDLFLQICDAVGHAHRRLTVHRDLKPSNILVTEAGAVKLLDFGIAKLLQPDADESEAPATAAILTPEYASPEQIRRERITTASDVFSLGILLYEMLSGAHPFRGDGRLPHEVMRAIVEDDPPPMSAVAGRNARELRGDLDAIALTALRKRPDWRYPSVEQLADDVNRYRRGLPVLAKGDRLSYRLGKFARRHWLPLAAAALLMTVLAAGVVATNLQARAAETASAAAERARAQAEVQRRIADQERTRAESNQRVAEEQRALAEARTRDVEAARRKEQERYRDLRALTASLLFDLHDGIRDLAGSTMARRLIVEKAQHTLELLSADGEHDPDLQRDLAACYERMGELRVDPHRPDKNDAGAALDAYRHAVALRRGIAAAPFAQPGDRRDLALSLTKLGNGEALAGDLKQAAAFDTEAWELALALVRAEPADPSMRRALGSVDERRCIILLTSGRNSEALAACQEGIATLTPLAQDAPNDIQVQRMLASTEASNANALRFSGKPEAATQQARLALASLDRLQILAPENAEFRRMSASAEIILAGSLARTGDQQGSEQAYRRAARATELAVEIDPADLQSPLRLAVTLLALSRREASRGDKTSAHETARQALGLLRAVAEKPGAGAVEWNEYADALLKTDWPDLADNAEALRLAQKSVSATDRKNPFCLDTLAWAYFRTGDSAKAAATERDALSLLPANAHGGLHDELQQGLNTFLAAASPQVK
jgi:eukaryotic-like serine/threonine-protein kinase